MTMVVPEVLGDTTGAAEGAGNSARKIGLTGSQKAAAVGRGLPTAKTSHPYVVGLVLTVMGGFMLIGSITGALPSMIAALFVPNALVDTSGNSPSPNIINQIGKVANPLSNFGIGLP